MKVKDILERLSELDPELEVTTQVGAECFSDEYSSVYGIDPSFEVSTLYEYRDMIFDEKEEVLELIADDEDTDDEDEIQAIFLKLPMSRKLIVKVFP